MTSPMGFKALTVLGGGVRDARKFLTYGAVNIMAPVGSSVMSKFLLLEKLILSLLAKWTS